MPLGHHFYSYIDEVQLKELWLYMHMWTYGWWRSTSFFLLKTKSKVVSKHHVETLMSGCYCPKVHSNITSGCFGQQNQPLWSLRPSCVSCLRQEPMRHGFCWLSYLLWWTSKKTLPSPTTDRRKVPIWWFLQTRCRYKRNHKKYTNLVPMVTVQTLNVLVH